MTVLPEFDRFNLPDRRQGADGPAVFTRERRIRFLDNLATRGNVRAAAARAGVSHETAYRARRQDANFARLWDAALVHARSYCEDTLATRAIDGVQVPIVYHGEIMGYRVHHDPRLLLAHLARLDRRVEQDAAAVARAGRFDEALAAYAGHEMPDDFADAAGECPDDELPPTRKQYQAFARGEAMGCAEVEEGADEDAVIAAEAEAEALAAAAEDAGEVWDEWHDASLALVDAIVGGVDVEEVALCEAHPQPLPQAGGGPVAPGSGSSDESPLPFTGGVGGGQSDSATSDGCAEGPGDSASHDECADLPYETKSAKFPAAEPCHKCQPERLCGAVGVFPRPLAGLPLIYRATASG